MEPRALHLLLELILLATSHGQKTASGPRSPLLSPPTREKAGSCPLGKDRDVSPSKHFCLSDAFCPGSEKCCSVGSVRTCVQPTTVGAGYCPWVCSPVEEPCLVTCLDDTWCGPGEKCCLNGCHICCVVAEPAKPGVCPRKRVSPTTLPCANQCVDDRSCQGEKKCCFTGCGLGCVSPHIVKPGACPLLLRGSLGPCAAVTLKRCSRDLDCEEAKKCCWTGCQHVCLVPDEVHPGTCPPRAAENRTSQCDTFCVRDADCPKSQKCCRLSCGHSCIASVPGEPD